MLPTWADVPLSAVSHADVSAWTAALASGGLSLSTVRQTHRVLSLVLGLAVRDCRMSQPSEAAPLPHSRPSGKRFLDSPEVAALADAAAREHPEYRLAVRVRALCGLRFGQLAALRVGRVDLLRRRMDICESVSEVNGRAVFGTPKSNLSRSVPLPRRIADELAQHMAGKSADAFVFAAPGGSVLSLRNFRRRVFRPRVRRGRPGWTHSARDEAHRGEPGGQRRGEPEGGPADARALCG